MNPYRLKSYAEAPPGTYTYTQVTGISREFPPQPLIEAQAKIVSAFRQGNNLPRASLLETLEDVDRQNCYRLGNNLRWCYYNDQRFVASEFGAFINGKGCAGCGAKLED